MTKDGRQWELALIGRGAWLIAASAGLTLTFFVGCAAHSPEPPPMAGQAYPPSLKATADEMPPSPKRLRRMRQDAHCPERTSE